MFWFTQQCVTRLVGVGAPLVVGLLVAACGATEEFESGDVRSDVDPFNGCVTRSAGEVRGAAATGACSVPGLSTQVVTSGADLSQYEDSCAEMVEQLEVLLDTNPDREVLLMTTSVNASCGVRVESAVSYHDQAAVTLTLLLNDASAGCDSQCDLTGGVWAAFVIEPETTLDFCYGTVGGCL